MPNPKRRHSKARTAKRRTHDSLKAVGLSECPHCHEPKPPHRAPRTVTCWVSVDAMGGDDAPRAVVDGALAAARHLDLGVALVGPGQLLETELGRRRDFD